MNRFFPIKAVDCKSNSLILSNDVQKSPYFGMFKIIVLLTWFACCFNVFSKEAFARAEGALGPALEQTEGNQFIVAEDLNQIRDELIDMNDMVYALGKMGESVKQKNKYLKLFDRFYNDGWDIETFKGFSGKDNRAQDTPGFVAFHKQDNIIVIVLRGSQTKASETKSADWEVNLDSKMIPGENTNGGKFHRGFWLRTEAMINNIMDVVYDFFKQVAPKDRSTLRIFVTGHSQGAAIATLVSAFLCEELATNDFMGPSFDNKKSNNVIAYVLSAPRIGDDEAVAWIHSIVGKENVIRQNVESNGPINDPVPYGLGGKTTTEVMKKIPLVGGELAKMYGNGASSGYLAADIAQDTLKRALLALKNGGLKLNIEGSSFTERLLNGAKSIAKSAFDSGKIVIAALHYGGESDVEDGLFFKASLVKSAPDIATLLSQGVQMKEERRAAKGDAGGDSVINAANNDAQQPQDMQQENEQPGMASPQSQQAQVVEGAVTYVDTSQSDEGRVVNR